MNRKEYKLLFESWNKLLKEESYDLNINIDDYEKEKIINFVWTAIQTLDPTRQKKITQYSLLLCFP